MPDLVCPRCGGKEFINHECGPDTYEDDVTWLSYTCKICGLRYAGWRKIWVVNCESWQEEENAVEWQPSAMKRDLQRDLRICNAATSGTWPLRIESLNFIRGFDEKWVAYMAAGPYHEAPRGKSRTAREQQERAQERAKKDAEFMAEACEGWPEAIYRALKAEARVKELEVALAELITKAKAIASFFLLPGGEFSQTIDKAKRALRGYEDTTCKREVDT